ADCTSPPGPAACFVAGTCSGVGGSCSYTIQPGAVVCGDTCCRSLQGTCNVDCTLTCASGVADCDGDTADGCEQSLHDVEHCGDCATACSYANAVAACPSGTCVLSACADGYQNCDAQEANGCECQGNACCSGGACQVRHANGLGQSFFDCTALGTHDQTQA